MEGFRRASHKYLDPWIIHFIFAEIFESPEQIKILKYLDLLKIFYPSIILHWRIAYYKRSGDNKSHLKYLIPLICIAN